MPVGKYNHSITGKEKSIITSGGVSDQLLLKSAEEYKTYWGKWQSLPNMNHKRRHHASCIVNKVLFCFFGTEINTIEYLKFDTHLDWTDIKFEFDKPKMMPIFAVPFKDEILVFTKNNAGLLTFELGGKFK